MNTHDIRSLFILINKYILITAFLTRLFQKREKFEYKSYLYKWGTS